MFHYKHNNKIFGWGPTVEEIDHLGTKFDKILHIAFSIKHFPEKSYKEYKLQNIDFDFVDPAGGQTIKEKLKIVSLIPQYIKTILKHRKHFDAIHIRCPANISLISIILFSILKKPKIIWVKYAGNWNPTKWLSFTSFFQKWWLNTNMHRGLVTINGKWPNQPKHVKTFLNPSFTKKDYMKNIMTKKKSSKFIKIIFVGRIEKNKGMYTLFKIILKLIQLNVKFKIDIVGDGPEKKYYSNKSNELGMSNYVNFIGWVSRENMNNYYARSHFNILPSLSEGWPKVLSEGMQFGVIPIANDVGAISQILKQYKCGKVIKKNNVNDFVKAILFYINNPNEWNSEIEKSKKTAINFTYEKYLDDLSRILNDKWKICI